MQEAALQIEEETTSLEEETASEEETTSEAEATSEEVTTSEPASSEPATEELTTEEPTEAPTTEAPQSWLPAGYDSWEAYVNDVLPQPETLTVDATLELPAATKIHIKMPAEVVTPPEKDTETGLYLNPVRSFRAEEVTGVMQQIAELIQAGRDGRELEIEEGKRSFVGAVETFGTKITELEAAFSQIGEENDHFQKEVLDYDFVSYLNPVAVERLFGNLLALGTKIEGNVGTYLDDYTSYAMDAGEVSEENISLILHYIETYKEEADAKMESGLKGAQESREKSNTENAALLTDLTTRLPYTRIGTMENLSAYAFMAQPLEMTPKAEGAAASAGLAGNALTAETDGGAEIWKLGAVVMLGLLFVLITVVVIRFYKKRLEEF